MTNEFPELGITWWIVPYSTFRCFNVPNFDIEDCLNRFHDNVMNLFWSWHLKGNFHEKKCICRTEMIWLDQVLNTPFWRSKILQVAWLFVFRCFWIRHSTLKLERSTLTRCNSHVGRIGAIWDVSVAFQLELILQIAFEVHVSFREVSFVNSYTL